MSNVLRQTAEAVHHPDFPRQEDMDALEDLYTRCAVHAIRTLGSTETHELIDAISALTHALPEPSVEAPRTQGHKNIALMHRLTTILRILQAAL